MAKKQRHGQKQKQQKAQKQKAAANRAARKASGQDSNASKPAAEKPAAYWAASIQQDKHSSNLGLLKDAAHVRGLVNLGNTCFFNSAVQVLMSSSDVVEHYLKPAKRGPLGGGLHEIAKAFYGRSEEANGDSEASSKKKGGHAAFNPHRLHTAVLRVAPHFKGGQEQDSHELLRLLLEGLHQEEARLAAKQAAREPDTSGSEEEEGEAPTAPKVPQSFVAGAFGAQLTSSIECTFCHHTSTNVEEFMDLSVEIATRIQPAESCSRDEEASPEKEKRRLKKSQEAQKAPEGSGKSAKQQRKLNKQAKKAADMERKKDRKASRKEQAIADAAAEPVEEFVASKPQLDEQPAGSSESEKSGQPSGERSGEEKPESSNVEPTQSQAGAEESSAEPSEPAGRRELGAKGGEAEADASKERQQNGEPPIEEDGEEMNLEGLFDVVEEAVVPCYEDSGSTEEESGSPGKGCSLEACLAAFFRAEEVMWECPGEKAARTNSAAKITPGVPRSVSFSDLSPKVKLIPGSVEQRGTDLEKALKGGDIFRRSFKVEDACLQVTAEVDVFDRQTLHLGLHPNDDTLATMALLPDPLCVADVDIPPILDPADEAEQESVKQRALLLIDSVADLVLAEGVTGALRMAHAGLELLPPHSPRVVRGRMPDDDGGGVWEYPVQTPTLQPGSPYSRLSENAAETPRTPHSVDSFESIDLAASPVRRPQRSVRPEFANGLNESDEAAASSQELAGPGTPERLEPAAMKPSADASGEEADAALPPIQEMPSLEAMPSMEELEPTTPLQNGRTESTQGGQFEANSRPATPPLKSGLKNAQRAAKKGYLIHRPPQLLTVHLKRFQMDVRGRAKKLSDPVAFGLQLDVNPWCDRQGKDEGGTAYELVGIVEHQGASLRSGHYVAYVRRQAPSPKPSEGSSEQQEPIWFRISDSHVTRVALDDLLRVQAYILLYTRRL